MGGGGAGGSDFDIVKLLGNPIVQVLGVVFIVYWMMHRH